MGAKITEIHEPHPRSCLGSWARKEEPELSSWASLTGSTCHWIGSVSAFSLKVTSGGSILWADSKVICCFLIETTKYYVYLVVFARNTEFCWKNKNFDFLKTGVKTLLKTRKFHKKLTFFVCMLVENRCFHFFEKHEITLLWGIQNCKIL